MLKWAGISLLLFLPCVLLLPALGTRRPSIIPLTALFAASPVIMESATYTWTKSLPAFFVVLALALYLAGRRRHEPTRIVAAFVALTAGFLAHYSAGPYLAFLALHYGLNFFRRRPRPWREAALIAAACALLAGTWFGWSARVYGLHATLASNTSVSYSAGYDGSNLEKIAANIYDTIVPAWLRGEADPYTQSSAAGQLRDQAFAFYQLNLVFAMGVIGGPLVLWLLWRRLVRAPAAPERNFWRALVPFCVVLGIAVVGERDARGVPHLTLLALEALGLVFLAAHFRALPKFVRWLVIAGCLVDFSLGVFLQARIESIENTPARAVFQELRYVPPRVVGNVGPGSLSDSAWFAWATKHRSGLYPKWLSEIPRGHEADPAFQQFWPRIGTLLAAGIHDDESNWAGWAARHGGVFEHLGDWVAGDSGWGTDVASVVFAALFLFLLAAFARQANQAAPAVVPVAVKPRGKPPRARDTRRGRTNAARTS